MNWLSRICGSTCVWLVLAMGPLRGADIAFIVNLANPVQSLSPGALRDLFNGNKQKWPDGTKVTLSSSSDGTPERVGGLKFLYNMSEGEFFSFATQAAFSGHAASVPQKYAGSQSVVQAVAAVPGAVGFVIASAVTPKVKVVYEVTVNKK